MSAVTTEPTSHRHDEGHGHPSDLTYWKVGLFLAVLTGLEVSTYWWPHAWHKGAAVALIILMVIKFTTVVAYFMHLKFDAIILRRLFTTGLVVAVAVYMIALTSMTFWVDSGVPPFNDPPRAKPLPPVPTEVPASIPAGEGH
jgi:cytochrome c oxidase subunit 4